MLTRVRIAHGHGAIRVHDLGFTPRPGVMGNPRPVGIDDPAVAADFAGVSGRIASPGAPRRRTNQTRHPCGAARFRDDLDATVAWTILESPLRTSWLTREPSAKTMVPSALIFAARPVSIRRSARADRRTTRSRRPDVGCSPSALRRARPRGQLAASPVTSWLSASLPSEYRMDPFALPARFAGRVNSAPARRRPTHRRYHRHVAAHWGWRASTTHRGCVILVSPLTGS